MLRRLAVFARTHFLWISLVALGSTATYFWLHLEDYLGLQLHGAALLPELDTLPVASNASGPAADCGGIERGMTAVSSSAAAGPAR